jgi:hypothetical protein
MHDYELPVTADELLDATRRNAREAKALEEAGDPDGAEIARHAAQAFNHAAHSKIIRALPPYAGRKFYRISF